MNHKKILAEYFSLNFIQRRVIYTLIIFTLILYIIPPIKLKYFSTEDQIEINYIDSINQLFISKQFTDLENKSNLNLEMEDLFYFNPNEVSFDELISLGINDKVAKTILNFRSKGGVFYKKTDLLKIYGFNDTDFEKLYPYIILNEPALIVASKKTDSLFLFDPNIVTVDELLKLGLDMQLANRLVNYRNKGGKFKYPQDVLKIFGFDSTTYLKLENFIAIQEHKKLDADSVIIHKLISTKNIDINSADFIELKEVGFTDYNANGILAFRKNSGGFYAFFQLEELYGMDTSTLHRIKNQISINANSIQLINLNFASYEQLEKHAYISEKLAKSILDYRLQTGHFTSVSEVMKVEGMYQKLYDKLKPYLKI